MGSSSMRIRAKTLAGEMGMARVYRRVVRGPLRERQADNTSADLRTPCS